MLKLIKGSPKYRDKITDMLREWTDYNNEHPEANTSPWAIFKDDYRDFEHYIENLDRREAKDGFVPDSTWFCLDEDRDILVGAVNIRHYLNDFLLMYGGILENEVEHEGEILQRYWIDIK
ncbi:MAG: GNAT family N-acetyltransferase [Candidatus Avilachnospira sp.]